jgi:hypothetical protein
MNSVGCLCLRQPHMSNSSGGHSLSLPPPLWGRVGEGGSCVASHAHANTPTPIPSPQGGGEPAVHVASLCLTLE